jgi:hypothetical protein
MILNEFFESNKGGSEVKLNELGPAALAALGAAGGAGAWLVNKMFPDEGDPQFKKPEPPPEIKKPPQKPDDLDYSKRETLPSTRQGMGPRPERTVKEVDAKVEPPAGSWQDIWKQNPDIKNPHLIFPGQQIKLPNNTFAVVDRGDTLSGIAQRYQQGGYNTGREIAPNAASPASVRPAAQPAVPAARPAAQPTAPAARPAAQPSRTAQSSQSAMASFPTKSGRVYAADFNNPSGIGWDGKGKYTSYKSPEEGVLATKNLVSRYISNQTPYIKGPATPEQVVSTWVSGGVTPAEKIQGGRYLQSVRNELAAAGVQLDSQGRIPNTQAATDAITRAIVRHETSPKHLDKFAPYLNPKQAVPEDVTETSDYFRRREREEAIISGQKPARKKQPVQTSDYARRREQEKKAEKGVAEGSDTQLSIQQLATISDEALDNAYGYGRSSPGNTFGWQANLMSAAYAKKMIDAGVTDIEKISDAIHKGWNVTAQKFVQNPDQFDDTEKLRQAGKLEAKLQQRAKLMKINYAQLDNEEQEKDRVVARALLQAIKNQQGVAEAATDDPRFQKMMGNIQQSTPNPVNGYVAVSYASERPSKKIKGVTYNGKPMPSTVDPEEFMGSKIKFTPDQIEEKLMKIGQKYGWDSIDPGHGQGYDELYFDTRTEYTSATQRQLAVNIVKTVDEINKFFTGMNSSLQATGLPGYKVSVWQGMGENGNIDQYEDLSHITNIAKGQTAKPDAGPAIGKMILKHLPSYEAENDELGYDPQDFQAARNIANIYITKGERAGLQAQGDSEVSEMIDELLSDAGASGLRTIWDLDEQGMAEGSLNEGQYEMMMRNGQVKKFIAKDDADAKRIAAGHGAKSVIKLRGGVPAGKIAEQGVAEVSSKTLAAAANQAQNKYNLAASSDNNLSHQEAQALMKLYKDKIEKFKTAGQAAQQRDSKKQTLSQFSSAALRKAGVAEVSDATKQSYKAKAQAQVRELEPHAKKGEYKDIAQRAIDRRTKGLARIDVKDAQKLAPRVSESFAIKTPEGRPALGQFNMTTVVRDYHQNLPFANLSFGNSGNLKIDRKQMRIVMDHYLGLLSPEEKHDFVYETMSRLLKVVALFDRYKVDVRNQIELPVGQKSEIPGVQPKLLEVDAGQVKDTRLSQALKQARAAFPTAGSDIEAFLKLVMSNDDRDLKTMSQLQAVNQQQSKIIDRIQDIDKKQNQEIDSLDAELDRVTQINKGLERKLDQMGRGKPSKKADKAEPAPAAEPAATAPKAQPKVDLPVGSKVPVKKAPAKARATSVPVPKAPETPALPNYSVSFKGLSKPSGDAQRALPLTSPDNVIQFPRSQPKGMSLFDPNEPPTDVVPKDYSRLQAEFGQPDELEPERQQRFAEGTKTKNIGQKDFDSFSDEDWEEWDKKVQRLGQRAQPKPAKASEPKAQPSTDKKSNMTEARLHRRAVLRQILES